MLSNLNCRRNKTGLRLEKCLHREPLSDLNGVTSLSEGENILWLKNCCQKNDEQPLITQFKNDINENLRKYSQVAAMKAIGTISEV